MESAFEESTKIAIQDFPISNSLSCLVFLLFATQVNQVHHDAERRTWVARPVSTGIPKLVNCKHPFFSTLQVIIECHQKWPFRVMQ